MSRGRFGNHGGQYIPETLMNAVIELEEAYNFYVQCGQEHSQFNPDYIEVKDGVPVYDLLLSSGSTDNIKPELVIKAFHEYIGLPEFDELSLDIHRVDMYTGEPDSFVSLGDIGDER